MVSSNVLLQTQSVYLKWHNYKQLYASSTVKNIENEEMYVFVFWEFHPCYFQRYLVYRWKYGNFVDKELLQYKLSKSKTIKHNQILIHDQNQLQLGYFDKISPVFNIFTRKEYHRSLQLVSLLNSQQLCITSKKLHMWCVLNRRTKRENENF